MIPYVNLKEAAQCVADHPLASLAVDLTGKLQQRNQGVM
jgi:hypothetical protein